MSIDKDVEEWQDLVSKDSKWAKHKAAKQFMHRIGVYKLGQDINNGVRYWGQDRTKDGHRSAMFICPCCKELWRARIIEVISGRTKKCKCRKPCKENT